MDPERLAEQRARLPQAVYEQLFENRWTQAEGSFLDPALVAAAFTLEGPTVDRRAGSAYVAGLDLGHVSDRSAFALGHREGSEIHLDRLQSWQGSRARPVDFAELERFVCAVHERFRFTLRLDPWQAIALAQRLRERGIRTEELHFGPASKQRLAASLLEGINTGTLKLYPADGLREELLGLRLKQTTTGAWSFDHTQGGHDDRAIAISLMLIEALERPSPSWHPMYTERDDEWLHKRGYRREGTRAVRIGGG
jgi:hypothetical protein